MVIALERNERSLKKINELEQALSHIKRLEGILLICSHCKQIRLKGGKPENPLSWVKIEGYLSTRTDTLFSHSLCPECLQKFYSDFNGPD